ncbi:MAG TPA: hypothetical protein PK339_00785 [Flavitalea sp.]|nr:hypothetical protein [Flavitalea sp.]
MDLEKTLLKEHSKEQCDAIVAYIGEDPRKFARLMNLFLSGDALVRQRAGWPLSYCVQSCPGLALPYFDQLLKMLTTPNIHPAISRNITRLFQYTPVPKRFQGRLMDACFGFISDPRSPIAVRAFSLSILEKMTEDYPEIFPEIQLIIEEHWDEASAAFRSRAKRIMARQSRSKPG